MALTASGLAALVFRDHITLYPDSIDAVRENAETGVPKHIAVEAFIDALCEGFVNALAQGTILDLGSGDDDVDGEADPVRFELPGIESAKTQFLLESGWVGEEADPVIDVFIGGILRNTESMGLLQMSTNKQMGTGTSQVSPRSNPDLKERLQEVMEKTLEEAFQASGKFAEGDIPGNPINATLAEQLGLYASALSLGVASIVATVSYTGAGGGSSISNVVNSGSIV